MHEDHLLEPLVSVIQTARYSIDNNRDYVSKNEIRTRDTLVEPVLRALGWDVSVLENVQVEYGTGNALLGREVYL